MVETGQDLKHVLKFFFNLKHPSNFFKAKMRVHIQIQVHIRFYTAPGVPSTFTNLYSKMENFIQLDYLATGHLPSIFRNFLYRSNIIP